MAKNPVVVELNDEDSIVIMKNGVAVAILSVKSEQYGYAGEVYEHIKLVGHGVTVKDRIGFNDRFVGSVASSMSVDVDNASADEVAAAL